MDSKVVVDISMSLDGYVAAPGFDMAHGLGVGGEVVHEWVLGDRSEVDDKVLDDTVAATGAVVMGRRLFDFVDGPNGWSDTMGYGGDRDQSDQPPYFVVTHRAPESVRLTGDFTFVTDGIAGAVEQAKAAVAKRGNGGDVVVMGGANVCDQCVAEGLADEIRIHLSPVILGGGIRLFDRLRRYPSFGNGSVSLDIAEVRQAPRATHLVYRVRR